MSNYNYFHIWYVCRHNNILSFNSYDGLYNKFMLYEPGVGKTTFIDICPTQEALFTAATLVNSN